MSAAGTHVVLGGNGVAGRETVRALVRRDLAPVSVGRRASPVEGARSVVADLLVADDVQRALRGADVAYLTAGLPYSGRVWAAQWPVLVRNTIEAAIANRTALVYLDNVYAYGRVDGPMTERTPIRPSSRKGGVRADALRMLESAADRGLDVTVARSADFYGPGAATGVFTGFVLDRIASGRTPGWLLDADQPHSLTFTPDLGEALAVLGTSSRPRDGVWHLPTAPARTVREYAAVAAGAPTEVKVMSGATLRLGAVFARPARETLELAYQFAEPSVLDSSAFEASFGMAPTPIEVGLPTALAAGASVHPPGLEPGTH